VEKIVDEPRPGTVKHSHLEGGLENAVHSSLESLPEPLSVRRTEVCDELDRFVQSAARVQQVEEGSEKYNLGRSINKLE